jgi:hypothetical protein
VSDTRDLGNLGCDAIDFDRSDAPCVGASMTRFPFALALCAVLPAAARADELPPLSIYGFARLDVLADDARMSDIAQPMYVMPDAAANRGGELTMTPRLSRVGLGIDTWQLGNHATGEGKLEVDFGGAGSTAAIRLRHAYAAVAFERTIELLAGQTADLLSPLFPSAQNDTQLLFAGNTGDRRPQIQLSITPGDRLRAAAGVATTGWLSQTDLDDDGRLDGTASMRPMLQWLIEYRQRTRGDVLRVGVWGHTARSELADGTSYGGSSVGMHLYLPIARKLIAFGEAYTGSNLADIGGGIAQSVNAMTREPIRGAGGWLELAALATSRHMLAAGATIDTARPSDLADGARERNQTFYGVVRYKPLDALQLGVEYVHWRTRYKAAPDGVANRVNLHASVLF